MITTFLYGMPQNGANNESYMYCKFWLHMQMGSVISGDEIAYYFLSVHMRFNPYPKNWLQIFYLSVWQIYC